MAGRYPDVRKSTYYHPDGTASRVCSHDESWMNADGERVCSTCGATTRRNG